MTCNKLCVNTFIFLQSEGIVSVIDEKSVAHT